MEHCSEVLLTLHAGEVSTTQTGFSALEEECRNVSVQAHRRKAPFISLLLFCFKSPFTSTAGMRPSITLNTFSQLFNLWSHFGLSSHRAVHSVMRTGGMRKHTTPGPSALSLYRALAFERTAPPCSAQGVNSPRDY